jgi:hypothetical protein
MHVYLLYQATTDNAVACTSRFCTTADTAALLHFFLCAAVAMCMYRLLVPLAINKARLSGCMRAVKPADVALLAALLAPCPD